MHPAGSLIYFTVASGFGFGVLFYLGLGLPEVEGQTAFWSYFVGYFLAVSGLMASVFHLGNKINAVKALSQWRSSWLSREGLIAIAALITTAPVAITKIFGGPDLSGLGYLAACLCLGTVYCTAMIYGQLKTVPRWNQALTPFLFLMYAIAVGNILGPQVFSEALLLLVLTCQVAHWVFGDRAWARNADTSQSATGLGGEGDKVRLLERPHTGKNYLTTEMVHMVGRKHSARLRLLVCGGLIISFAGSLFLSGMAGLILLFPLAVSALVSRWLFFAEAEHVVGLYYGRGK